MKKRLLVSILAAALAANSAMAVAGNDITSVTAIEEVSWYDKLIARVMTKPRVPRH